MNWFCRRIVDLKTSRFSRHRWRPWLEKLDQPHPQADWCHKSLYDQRTNARNTRAIRTVLKHRLYRGSRGENRTPSPVPHPSTRLCNMRQTTVVNYLRAADEERLHPAKCRFHEPKRDGQLVEQEGVITRN